MNSITILRRTFQAALALCFIAPALSADAAPANPTVVEIIPTGGTGQFGKFTYSYSYTDSGAPLTITGCAKDAVGAVTIPATIDVHTGLRAIPPTPMIKTIPVSAIAADAFSGCSGLTSVTIPDSVTSIWNNVFRGCDNLTAIVVDPANPNYTSQDGVLFDKQKSTLVTYPGGKQGSYSIPGSVTSIGRDAFQSCTGLIGVTIPDGVTSIVWSTFSDCAGLTGITIGSGVTSIINDVLYGCTGLTAFVVDPGNTSYASQDGVLFDAQKSTLVKCPSGKQGRYSIPASVTSVGDVAFEDCTGLTNVTIPASVTSIGDGAFSYCTSLTTVAIPNSVTSIGTYAFHACNGLTRGAFLGNAPTMENGVFDSCASGFTVSYLKGKTGFTWPTWMGYPAMAVNPAAPEIDVQQPVGSKLVDGVAKKSFGTAKVRKTGTTKIFTIKNTGTATLSGLAITKTGSQKGDFIVTAPFKTSLAPGAATTFKATFLPRAVGNRNASIQIMSNDANESPFDIKLTGLGVTP